MSNYILKQTAQTLTNGFGKFIACEEAGSLFDALAASMEREYADRNNRIDGTVIQYTVTDTPIANQAEFDAYCRAQLYGRAGDCGGRLWLLAGLVAGAIIHAGGNKYFSNKIEIFIIASRTPIRDPEPKAPDPLMRGDADFIYTANTKKDRALRKPGLECLLR